MEALERIQNGRTSSEICGAALRAPESGSRQAPPAEGEFVFRPFGESVDLPVLFTRNAVSTGDRLHRGRIVELGPRGCRLQTDQRLEDDEQILLQFDSCYLRFGRARIRPAREGSVRGRAVLQRGGAPTDREGDHSSPVHTFAVRFERDLELAREGLLGPAVAVIGVLSFAVAVVVILCLKQRNVSSLSVSPLLNVYSLSVAFYVLSRFFIAGFYRPPSPAPGFAPMISVIIAAKDEEASIGRTLDYIYLCDYPRNRLEVIAVDDGSTDGTAEEMLLAGRRNPGLRIVRFPTNKGKRHAMAEGVKQATGEILVFVDSDTFLHPDALRKLVRGFADPQVAAVCGHAYVQNTRATYLTRMQEVRYYVSFRVLKGAESVFGTVTCCSGCLSAYRRSAVLEVLDRWLYQRFLGSEATFGDDRSLTNHLLRRHRIIYDGDAVCTTIVPEKVRTFFRQQLRWKKSWLRESLIASGFLWKRHPLAALFFYLQAIISLVSPFCVLSMLLLPLFGVGRFSAVYAFGILMVACLYGLFYLIRFRDRLWFHGLLFQFLFSILLAWQIYYALFTVRRNHWGTR